MGTLRRIGRRGAQALMVVAVHAYRVGLSPHLGGACRYEPSCSAYALEALRLHGPWRGAALAARRVARCHPFRPGGLDPVPAPGEIGRRAASSRPSAASAAGIGGFHGP
jgi:putative membrane protein insertion efficiency factor